MVFLYRIVVDFSDIRCLKALYTIQHSHNGQDLQDCDGASRRVHLEPGEPVLRLVRRRAQRERSVHSQHR